jgi:cytochrome P450
MQRDPRYFEDPLDFMPERWTDEKPGAIIDKRAYAPFNIGAHGCVGKTIAMTEMRTVAANLFRLFDVSFAEGEDGSTIANKTMDSFSLIVGKLDVKLTPRYKAQGDLVE